MIPENLQQIQSQLPAHCSLLAVSKTKPITAIEVAYDCGQRDFGENKVQELFEKATQLRDKPEIRWHFIGSLQSNKVNKLLETPHLAAIHSIDRLSLLEKVLKKPSSIGLFLQINTSGEVEKSGFTEADHIHKAISLIKAQKVYRLQGLMTMGSIRAQDFEQAARASFKQLQELKSELDAAYGLDLELSMGMSQDFLLALEYGSHWVRIGSQIFGKRS